MADKGARALIKLHDGEEPLDPAEAAERAFKALEAEEAARGDGARAGRGAVEAGAEDDHAAKSVDNITLTIGKKSYLLEVVLESLMGSGDDSQENSRVVEKGSLGFSDLLKELGRQGIKMQRYQDPGDGTHYVGLQVKATR